MIAALLWAAVAAAPVWIPVGETGSRLRVFFDRSSVRDVGSRRRVRVRLGAPHAITGRIVLAYEDEEFDCAARRWRLLSFEARDENDQIVQQGVPARPQTDLLPVVEHSIGGEIARAVCGIGHHADRGA